MALLGPRGAAVMAETSGPESTNSCDHFSYFKPLGTRRLPSHQPGAVTQHCRPRARDRSLGACVSRAWVGFFFFKKREFHFLSTRLCQTVLVFSVHRLMSCHLGGEITSSCHLGGEITSFTDEENGAPNVRLGELSKVPQRRGWD